MKPNNLRKYWDNRYNFKRKYNYLMEDIEIEEKVIDSVFSLVGKAYRFLEGKAYIFISKHFDVYQRKQLLISKYLAKFMVIICVTVYLVSGLVWEYNARTQKVLIPTVEAKSEVIEKVEIKPDYSTTELVDYIHLMESSRGFANTGLSVVCKDRGQTNEYGYRAMEAWEGGNYYPEKAFCFNSQAEAVLTIAEWVNKYVEKYGTYEAMCIYNTGTTKNGNCEYVEILKSWRTN